MLHSVMTNMADNIQYQSELIL